MGTLNRSRTDQLGECQCGIHRNGTGQGQHQCGLFSNLNICETFFCIVFSESFLVIGLI